MSDAASSRGHVRSGALGAAILEKAMSLVVIAVALPFGYDLRDGAALATGSVRIVAGVIAEFPIGVMALLLGVAGGESLILTLVLLSGADIKLAGSPSLAVGLSTMLLGFTPYSPDRAFAVFGRDGKVFVIMPAGSIGGAFIGGLLLEPVLPAALLPMPAAILRIRGRDGPADRTAGPVVATEIIRRPSVRRRLRSLELRRT